MKKPLITSSLFVVLGLGALGAAHAATGSPAAPGPYIGLQVGEGTTSLQRGGLDSAVGTQGYGVASGHQDTQDTAYGVYGGYRFTPNWAAEIGYVKLGEFGYQSNVSSPTPGVVGGDWRAQGFTATGVGTLPLARNLSAYGRLGVIAARTERTSSGLGSGTAKHDGTGLVTGAGLAYDITPKVATTLEWTRYSKLGDPSTGYGAVNTYTAGLKYSF